jgi:hypothetical protein
MGWRKTRIPNAKEEKVHLHRCDRQALDLGENLRISMRRTWRDNGSRRSISVSLLYRLVEDEYLHFQSVRIQL